MKPGNQANPTRILIILCACVTSVCPAFTGLIHILPQLWVVEEEDGGGGRGGGGGGGEEEKKHFPLINAW